MRSISSRSNFCSSISRNFRRSSTRTRSNRRSSMANCCKRSSSFLRKATSSSALCVPFLFRVYGGRALGCVRAWLVFSVFRAGFVLRVRWILLPRVPFGGVVFCGVRTGRRGFETWTQSPPSTQLGQPQTRETSKCRFAS